MIGLYARHWRHRKPSYPVKFFGSQAALEAETVAENSSAMALKSAKE
jgi:hypothetical protein